MNQNLDCSLELSFMEENQTISDYIEDREVLDEYDTNLVIYEDESYECESRHNRRIARQTDKLYDEEEDEFDNEGYRSEGYEWTEEDSWDALTDGMYGEMPRNPIAYDAAMEAMGY